MSHLLKSLSTIASQCVIFKWVLVGILKAIILIYVQEKIIEIDFLLGISGKHVYFCVKNWDAFSFFILFNQLAHILW